MKILITGACGYVGYSILQHLLLVEQLEKVVIYDNLYRKNSSFFIGNKFPNWDKIQFIQGDILDNYTLEKALRNIDTVIHLAAKASTPFSDTNGHEFDQVNNWGTSLVVNAIEKLENIKRVIYLSSIAVYGNTKGEEVTEESITVPKSFYGISKLKGEKHIKRLNLKKETYIFRVANIFGYNPCLRTDAVVNKFMFDAQYKGKVEIHGTGNQKRAFTSIDCIGQFIAKFCFQEELDSGLFNLVNYNLSVNEIVEYLKVLYPDLETLHLDQHLEMRSITANSIYDIGFKDSINTFEFHLKKFKNQFSF